MVNWEILANKATVFALILALFALLKELKSNREERDFNTFLKLLEYYDRIMKERQERWTRVREKIKANPKNAHEVGDRTSSLDYLITRKKQKEPLYNIEHSMLGGEIESLNLLNALCKKALRAKNKELILKINYSDEIVWYQLHLEQLLDLRESEIDIIRLPIPHYTYLQKFKADDYMQKEPPNK